MRILIITQVFSPEMGALANRMQPIVRHLADAGHEVFVATGMPNYPEGVVFPGYEKKRFMREEMFGATVLRTASFTAPRNQSKWSQLRSYLSFVPAVFHSGLRAGKVDAVLVTSPPIFPVAAGIALAKCSRAELILDIRDLWPDEIIACGAAREGSLAVRLVRAIERWGYRSAARVCCTTPSFLETVVARGVERKNACLLPNGADLERFRPLPRQNEVTAGLPLRDRFVVTYSGLLGIKHGLEVVLDTAALLREHQEILFCLVGAGPRREALEERARELGLRNVLFLGEQPSERLPYLLAGADVCVSSLLPDPYLEKIISAKLFEYLACERPVVAIQAGESARILEESRGGIAVKPGDAEAAAAAILALYRDPERRCEMGVAGREFVEKRHSRAAWAGRLEAMLRETCSETRAVRQPIRARSGREAQPCSRR